MEKTSLILLSRQTALQRQVEVIANNVANVNTSGFKAQQVLFETETVRPRFREELNFVIDRATLRDTNTGTMTRTGNDLDFALQGPGYFGVNTPQGVKYTRSGAFGLNSNGDIVTSDGNPVMSSDGQTLNIPADATQVTLDLTGRVMTDRGEVGTLQIVTFQREQEMIESGNNLFTTAEAGQQAAETRVVQGAVEQSNVKPVLEMTRMTEAVRAYQQTTTLLQTEHERLRNAIRTLGRVSIV